MNPAAAAALKAASMFNNQGHWAARQWIARNNVNRGLVRLARQLLAVQRGGVA